MTTLKNNEYIVFQPDQVLTNAHLNQLFYYLDRQNRLTRIKLIGMGIVCGFELEVVLNAQSFISTIKIDKGCGITSQGYLISDCEDKEYAYAIPYIPPPLPEDLPFRCIDKATGENNIPFYNNPKLDKQKCAGIYKLVTCDQYKTIVENPNSPTPPAPPCPPSVVTPAPPAGDQPGSTGQVLPIPLSSKDWTGYAVVLFLEAKELDLKNCDMQDCNNKGEKIIFHIRPLLVPETCLTNNCGKNGGNQTQKAPEIRFQRYNVLPNDISSAFTILDSFKTITSLTLLQEVADAYSFCFTKYGSGLQINGPYPDLFTNLKNILNGLVNNPLLTQYFYDYLNDLILAYYEFIEQEDFLNVQCCADECAFPLHLVLGDANKSTNASVKDCWRTYFIYAEIFDIERKWYNKARFYLNRMLLLANQFPNAAFKIPDEVSANKKRPEIKITPSQYEDFQLSQRAIPYYYPELPLNDKSIFQNWNYKKTRKGNAAFNLSYNASSYNASDPAVNTPLLYDIEKYNFFRIEGHIGLPYLDVMNELTFARQQYNLPFNLVALASDKASLVISKIPPCVINDLVTEFETILIEFLCKLLLCTRKLARTGYVSLNEVKASAKAKSETVTEPDNLNMDEFLKNIQFGKATYQAGDFIQFSKPAENTMGSVYMNAIKANQYTNPVDINKLNCDNLELNQSYSTGFEVLHATDALFQTFLNTDISKLNSSAVETQFARFNTNLNQLKIQTTGSAATGVRASVFSSALFEDCACDCLPCLLLDLLWLLSQIIKRIEAYELGLIFANYFYNHPGLEHKAGVPKGGTFVLVYSKADLTQPPAIVGSNIHSVRSEAFNNQDAFVIADFYLPYLCCSDCSPAVPAPPPTNITPTISVKKDICSNEGPVPIDTQPSDPNGQVISTSIGNALVKNADGSWSLDPSKIDFNNQLKVSDTLVYQLNGKSSQGAPVNIYQYPNSDFTFEGNISGIVLTPVIKNDPALTFKWTFYQNFGDGQGDIDVTADFVQHVTEITPVQYQISAIIRYLDLNNAKQGLVGLQVINGPAGIKCQSFTKKQVYPLPQASPAAGPVKNNAATNKNLESKAKAKKDTKKPPNK
jgi:hypothetical protein